MTPRQERFVREYQIDGDARAAAIRAGYSPHSAAQLAWRLLRRPAIAAAAGAAVLPWRRPLTARQRRFIHEYLADQHGGRAAVRAGYSRRSAAHVANHLLNHHPLVREAVAEALAAREARGRVTVDQVLAEYARLAFAEVADGAAASAGGRGPRLALRDKQAALDRLARHLGLFDKQAAAAAGALDRVETARQAREILIQRLDRLAAAQQARDAAPTPAPPGRDDAPPGRRG